MSMWMASLTWQNFGLVSARGFRDGLHVEPQRFQRVEQEGIADGLHIVIEDFEDGLFGLRRHGPFEIAMQMEAHQPLHLAVRADVPLERQIDPVVYPTNVQAVFEIRHSPVLLSAAEDACI